MLLQKQTNALKLELGCQLREGVACSIGPSGVTIARGRDVMRRRHGHDTRRRRTGWASRA